MTFIKFSVQKMEPVTEGITNDHSISEDTTDNLSYSSKYQYKLFSLFVISIFGIFLAGIIVLLRKYGCGIMTNLVRRISNYIMDINHQNFADQSIRTSTSVNEMLDGVSTEPYGDTTSSSLNWDPRFPLDAEIVTQNINEIAADLSISSQNGIFMIDQMTQTSDHSFSIDNAFNDSIIGINLKTDLSPIEMYPSFTAGIQLDSSDYDEDLTEPKKLVKILENDMSNIVDNQSDMSNIGDNQDEGVDSSPNAENQNRTVISDEDMNEVIVEGQSCTRSGLIYK